MRQNGEEEHRLGAETMAELLATAFAEAPIGMAIVAPEGRILRANRALYDLLGYPEGELLGLSFHEITHPEDLEKDVALLRETLAGGRRRYELQKRYVRADGEVVWTLLSAALVSDASGRPLHFISHIQDVTERRELELRLQRLADRDPLTGLFNRRRFEEDLIQQIARCARHGDRAAIAMIDLDAFKAINDTYGHAAGDDVLRVVAAALGERMRVSDTLARLGGDEFAAILIGVEEAQAGDVADALAAAVARSETIRPVAASVGVAALSPEDTVDRALARADAAMYAAKRARGDA
jgi:diguanylate cyclase (GGDEF)-like protein/PAS domain S-box-containing protein